MTSQNWCTSRMDYFNDTFIALFFFKLDSHGHNVIVGSEIPLCVEKTANNDNFRFASHLFLLTADFAQPFWIGTTDALNATLRAHVLWG